MKKILVLASIAIIALASCAKEQNVQNQIENEETVVLTFASERPQLDPITTPTTPANAPTRTEWSTDKIVWSTGDKIRVGYQKNSAWMGQSEEGTAKFYASGEVAIDGADASVGTFAVPIGDQTFHDPAVSATYQFFAIYPSGALSSTTVSDPAAHNITLHATQTPGNNTFDKSADILVGKSEALSLSGLPTDPIALDWTRLVAHADLTFSNLAFVGAETVNKITLTFNTEAKVAGSFEVNIPAGTAGEGSTNELVLSGSNITSGADFAKAWACVLPVTFTSLDVEVKTDKAVYTRSITGISKTFKQNARNTLTINMSTATRNASVEYDWVATALSSISASDIFVIVGNNGSNYAMSNGNGTSSAPTAVGVTIADNKLSAAPADNIQWTLTKDGGNYTFYPNGTTETWLYCTNTNNGVRVGTNDNKVFTLVEGYLKNSGTNRYVGVYNSQDWRCYTSNTAANIAGQSFAFYVRTTKDNTPTCEAPTFNPTAGSVAAGTAVSISCATDGASIYYTTDGSTPTTSSTLYTSPIIVNVATTINAIAVKDSYKNSTVATAAYTLAATNTSTEANPYSASEAKDLAEQLSSEESVEDVYVSGIISQITTAYDDGFKNVSFNISADGLSTGDQFLLFRVPATSATDYLVGDVVEFKGVLVNYNGNTPELKASFVEIYHYKAPRFSVEEGTYSSAQSVTLTADAGATIYYTIDGSTPTESSNTYSSALNIAATTTVKAFAKKDGVSTGVVSVVYTISAGVSLKYTLDGTITDGTNGYATESEINQNDIDWLATGNTTMNPWRIGGKNLNNEDRAIYSATAISSNISSIEVQSGSATATVNSLTISVHNSAADAASGQNAIATKTESANIISSTVTLTKADATSWAGKYYRIVYNVTTGTSNQYVQFVSAKFYGTN